MLEKTANEFDGFQGNGCVLAGIGVAIGPADLARGEQLQGPVTRGGFEDVSGQVSQGIFT
jgi:hypothetical protein